MSKIRKCRSFSNSKAVYRRKKIFPEECAWQFQTLLCIFSFLFLQGIHFLFFWDFAHTLNNNKKSSQQPFNVILLLLCFQWPLISTACAMLTFYSSRIYSIRNVSALLSLSHKGSFHMVKREENLVHLVQDSRISIHSVCHIHRGESVWGNELWG